MYIEVSGISMYVLAFAIQVNKIHNIMKVMNFINPALNLIVVFGSRFCRRLHEFLYANATLCICG